MESLRQSPQASTGDGPSGGPGATAGESTPHHAPWTLVRGGTGLSGARCSSVFRFAHSTLDRLEAQLATEEAELNSVRAELEQARARLLETVERCRHGDEAARAQREEVLRFAKEVRDSAAREAEETLAPVLAERSAAIEDRATAIADRAATEAVLAMREAKIIEDSESIRKSLDQHRETLEARERALATREAELARREEQVALAELDMGHQREELKAREGNIARAISVHEEEVAWHKVLIKKADERLARKKPEQDKEHEARLKMVRERVSHEYASKFKKQEERFKRRYAEDGERIRELEELNASLCSSAKRARETRDRGPLADPGGPGQPDRRHVGPEQSGGSCGGARRGAASPRAGRAAPVRTAGPHVPCLGGVGEDRGIKPRDCQPCRACGGQC